MSKSRDDEWRKHLERCEEIYGKDSGRDFSHPDYYDRTYIAGSKENDIAVGIILLGMLGFFCFMMYNIFGVAGPAGVVAWLLWISRKDWGNKKPAEAG